MAEESNVAQDQIKAYVDRILRMKEEAKAINADVREIYAEAKGNGFDKTVLGQLVSYVEKRQTDAATLAERSALFDLYLDAFDGAVGRPSHAHTREGASKLTYGDHLDEATKAAVDPIAALRADPAMAIVDPSNLKKPQSTKAAGSDPASSHAPQGRVADNPVAKAADDANSGHAMSEVSAVADAPEQAEVASRVAGDRAPDATSEVMDATAGETASLYPDPGVVYWESAPPEGVERHEYSAAFGTMGQDIAVIEDDLARSKAEPIVKMGNVILDGWARYMAARGMVGLDGKPVEYSVVQYDGRDPLLDCIRWNLAGRILTEDQKRIICAKLVKLYPQRKGPIWGAFEFGMELV